LAPVRLSISTNWTTFIHKLQQANEHEVQQQQQHKVLVLKVCIFVCQTFHVSIDVCVCMWM